MKSKVIKPLYTQAGLLSRLLSTDSSQKGCSDNPPTYNAGYLGSVEWQYGLQAQDTVFAILCCCTARSLLGGPCCQWAASKEFCHRRAHSLLVPWWSLEIEIALFGVHSKEGYVCFCTGFICSNSLPSTFFISRIFWAKNPLISRKGVFISKNRKFLLID